MTTVATHLLILGSSPLALTSCLLAKALGFSPTLVSAPEQPRDGKDPRAWSLTPATTSFLAQLGLHLPDKAPVSAMHVWHADRKGTPLPGHIDLGPENGAHVSHIVPNASLRSELSALVDSQGIDRIEASALEWQQGRVVSGNRAAALAIVCDPGWLKTLPKDKQPKWTAWNYDQRAISATVHLDAGHGGIARQVFLPDGPLALLPLPDERAASMIWSLRESRANVLSRLPDLSAKLSAYLQIDLTLDPANLISFPLSAQHARSYFAERAVFVGEAIHRVHPLAGQGLNLGFADVGALFDALVRARRRGTDIGSTTALAPYERARRPHNEGMIAATDQLKRLFGNNFGPARFVRTLGLSAFRNSPAQRWVEGVASGPAPLCHAL